MSIVKYRKLLSIFAAGLSLFLISGVLAVINFSSIDFPLVIHFDVFSGLNLIGSKLQIFTIIAIAFVINVINILLAIVSISRLNFLSYLLAASTVVVNLFILVTIIVLININL